MKTRRIIATIFLFSLLGAGPEQPPAPDQVVPIMTPAPPVPADPVLDLRPVVVRAGKLAKLVGRRREKLVALRWEDGRFKPIPVQADPRDANGYIIAGGGASSAPAPAGPVSAYDEIVWMASDAGARAPAAPPELDPAYEIELRDGLSIRFAYLGLATGSPHRSPRDYVAYRRTGQDERITTPRYVQVFAPEAAFFSDLMVAPPDGNGRDMFDRLKMRSRVKTVGGIEIRYQETDFRSRVTAVRDGPVRIIRQNRTSIELVFGLSTPEVLVDEIFYRDSFEVPSELRLPYGADLVVSEFDYYQGCDLNRAAGPFTFEADVGGPMRVDGVMTEVENTLARSNRDHRWGMVSGRAGSLFYTSDWFDPAARTRILLYYRDDARARNLPESEPGDAMYGFRLENGLALAGHGERLNIAVYVLARDMTSRQARRLTQPVSLSVRPLPR